MQVLRSSDVFKGFGGLLGSMCGKEGTNQVAPNVVAQKKRWRSPLREKKTRKGQSCKERVVGKVERVETCALFTVFGRIFLMWMHSVRGGKVNPKLRWAGLDFSCGMQDFCWRLTNRVEHGIDNRLGRKAGFMSGKVCPYIKTWVCVCARLCKNCVCV